MCEIGRALYGVGSGITRKLAWYLRGSEVKTLVSYRYKGWRGIAILERDVLPPTISHRAHALTPPVTAGRAQGKYPLTVCESTGARYIGQSREHGGDPARGPPPFPMNCPISR